MRVATGTSGADLGFPQDPMFHVSWSVLGSLAVLVAFVRNRWF
jgi:hypothetical protein